MFSGSSLFGHTFVEACRQRKEFKEMSEAFIPLVVKISCAHLKSPLHCYLCQSVQTEMERVRMSEI